MAKNDNGKNYRTGAGKTRAQAKGFMDIMLRRPIFIDPHEGSPLLGKIMDDMLTGRVDYVPPSAERISYIDPLRQPSDSDDGFIDGAGI